MQTQLQLPAINIEMHIGVTDEERHTKQPMLIGLSITFSETPLACISDQISDTVCYDALVQKIVTLAQQNHFHLIEHAAHAFYSAIRNDMPFHSTLALSVSKCKPPIAQLGAPVTFTYAPQETRVILGLGANLGDREKTLRNTIENLHKRHLLFHATPSSILENPALLPEDAPDTWNIPFLNMAVSGYSCLSPETLYHHIKELEIEMGREMEAKRWSPRTIDIDILAYGETHYQTDQLNIPHQALIERHFALAPLAELWPDWQYPIEGKYHKQSATTLLTKLEARHENA